MLEFHFQFRSLWFNRNRRVILHPAADFCPHRTTERRNYDVVSPIARQFNSLITVHEQTDRGQTDRQTDLRRHKANVTEQHSPKMHRVVTSCRTSTSQYKSNRSQLVPHNRDQQTRTSLATGGITDQLEGHSVERMYLPQTCFFFICAGCGLCVDNCNAPSAYCRRRIRNVLVTVTVTVTSDKGVATAQWLSE